MYRLFIILIALLTFSSFSFAGNYKLDKNHTNIGFEVTHMVITTVTGKFNDFDVELNWDKENPEQSAVEAVIKIASVDTENDRRDKHLRSADFFDAESHPDMVFKSDKISKADEGFIAHGTLTMRGVSKEIALPFKVKGPVTGPWGNERIGITATLTINRQEWGVRYSSVMDNGGLVVSDDVKILVNGQFIKSKEEGLSKK